LVTSYAQQVQNQAKCPHGFPVGACPICNGMMASSKRDRDKPRKPGEMSYNECLAEWHKIQARNEAKKLDRLEKLQMLKEMFSSDKIAKFVDKAQKVLNKFSEKIDNLPALIKAPAKFVIKHIVTPIINFISQIPSAIKNIQVFFESTRNFIYSVSEKLASVFGEIKNFFDEKVTKNFKKALKTLLSLFTSGEEEESEDAKKVKDRELKKILKSIFRLKHKEAKEEDDSKSV